MQELLDIKTQCGQLAFGGTVTLEYLPINLINTFPSDYELQDATEITEPIVPVSGAAWKKVMVYPQSVRFREKTDMDKQGKTVNSKFTADFPSSSNDVRRLFDRLGNHRFILKWENSNDDTFIVGSPMYPLRFEASITSAKKIKDGTQYSFSFEGISKYFAFLYNV